MSKVAIGQRVAFEYGYAVRVNDELPGPYPVFGSNGATGYIDSFKELGPGVVIGRKGSVGKVTFTKSNFTPTDTAYFLRILDHLKDDKKFWYYFLPLLGIEKLNTHSAVPGLSRELAYLIETEVPGLEKQKKIAAVLSSLDEKIDYNNRINAELEAMAKTLYEYWFVQFDFPDANGKPYKSSGGKMVYNATLKREIPADWNDGSLWSVARYFNGLAMQKYRPISDESLPVIKIKEMGEGLSSSTEKARPDIPEDAIVEDGDVLFSWSATLDVKIWTGGRGALNQHIFKVTSDKYPKTFYYFELLGYLAHFKMMAEKRKTTMGHITQDHLKQSRICIPPSHLLDSVHQKINPILIKHVMLEKENQQLVQLRDWLLPLLMNGQVTVA
jgi:type I restriction enzyme S subunit